MSDLQPFEWLGLLLRSESDQPHEWIPLAWVVRNRVEEAGGRYPAAYRDVILQPKQFSYFNAFIGLDPATTYDRARAGYAGDSVLWPDNDLRFAEQCAMAIMAAPRWQAPFSARVYTFWAPAAMKPAGSDPSWATDYRVLQLPGIPRWKFGELLT